VQSLNSSNQITGETNNIGYSKFIVIPGIPNVSTGQYNTFGSIAGALPSYSLVKPIACRGINANRQVQLVFRIITKEIDSSSRIRSDIL
jgi:hypothetical protein